MTQFAESKDASTINENDAAIIRGVGEERVLGLREYRVVRVQEINKTTGHCIIEVEGLGEVTGEIADPVMKGPDNVCTGALHRHEGLTVLAKLVTKDGHPERLVIGDAKP